MNQKSIFGSSSLIEHLLRGLAGIGLFAAALRLSSGNPWVALGFGAAAFVLFRGCPMCWTIGLLETVQRRLARLK